MADSDDEGSFELEVRIYWDLLEAVISPFLDSLPFHDQTRQYGRVPRPVPLIRSMLEWIGSNLDPQVYSVYLSKVPKDVQRELYEAFDSVLEKLEGSLSIDILNLRDEVQQDQEAGTTVRCLDLIT